MARPVPKGTRCDFRLIGPDHILRPIVSVTDLDNRCKLELKTRKIGLGLHKKLDVNGYYLLQIRTGTDGNTIVNECGFDTREHNSFLIKVDNCPDPYYQIRNVSVWDDQHTLVQWEVDTNAYFNDSSILALFSQC